MKMFRTSAESSYDPREPQYHSTKLINTYPEFDRLKALTFADEENNAHIIEDSIKVRVVETALLELFGRGRLHGTIHTCLGQEIIGILFGSLLLEGDYITSNHRCHGHFLGATKNWRGLIDEIVGNADGVCGGIGSSQHLYAPNFLSNGQQGGLLPIAAGIALDRKRKDKKNIVASFIGEGTLGQGSLYETMNIASLWSLPHIIICENNLYSQSTPQELSIAGEIGSRALAFDVNIYDTHTWDPNELWATLNEVVLLTRNTSRPAFVVIKTYRLNSHSKGDDFRDPLEVERFRRRDLLTVILEERQKFSEYSTAFAAEVEDYIEYSLKKPRTVIAAYESDQLPDVKGGEWESGADTRDGGRIGQQLNQFYKDFLSTNENAFFIGEDVHDPYGGAFKISSGLQTRFPSRVITTPISEAAITGIGIGLSIVGNKPIVEIMFGDFITLAFDQIINNASKFFHMYNRNVTCPVIIRTPMGGRRGYGPTHSQSLERFLIGIENLTLISTNSLISVEAQLSNIQNLKGPSVILENKLDYTLSTYKCPPGFVLEKTGCSFPTIAVRPQRALPNLTLVSYGNMARLLADNIYALFYECDLLPELIVPTSIHPIDIQSICQSAGNTQRLVVVEEGPTAGGVGSEIISQVLQCLGPIVAVQRIGALPLPIPSAPELENEVLPSFERVCKELQNFWRHKNGEKPS